MKYPLITVFTLCLFLTCNSTVLAGNMGEAETLFSQGYDAYERDDYITAIAYLEKATEIDQTRSQYYHYLGKSYGHLAEQSNWFKAMELSKKTLTALEQAVQLDRNNQDAVEDLIDYYRQAPQFLGGDAEKADALEKSTFGNPETTQK